MTIEIGGAAHRFATLSSDGRIIEIVEMPQHEVRTDSDTALTHRKPLDPVYRTDDGLPVEKIGEREYRIPALYGLVVVESFSPI